MKEVMGEYANKRPYSEFNIIELLEKISEIDLCLFDCILEYIIGDDDINDYDITFAHPGSQFHGPEIVLESRQEGKFDIMVHEPDVDRRMDRKKLEYALNSNLPLWMNLGEYL